jgi:hypothetical protein
MNNQGKTLTPFQFNNALDTKYLAGIFECDPENACYIFELYLAELPVTINSIATELQTSNISGLYETIHKTKTSFSFAGLTYITELMENIERKCSHVNSAKDLEGEVHYLLNEINQSTPLIEKEYSRLTLYSKAVFEKQMHYSGR